MSETIQMFEATGTADILDNHRYSLSRTWDKSKAMVMFIGLNPSRANAHYNDATIVRCINFAKSWGYGGLWFGNLYSFRTPYVTRAQLEKERMFSNDDEVWQPLIENLEQAHNATTDVALRFMIGKSDRVICAWGSFEFVGPRAIDVLHIIMETHAPYCLGCNSNGSPKHPLYLPKTTQMQLYV